MQTFSASVTEPHRGNKAIILKETCLTHILKTMFLPEKNLYLEKHPLC